MEGSYNKVLSARQDGLYSQEGMYFMDMLVDTVREEIAECSEKAYGSIAARDLQSLLMLSSEAELGEYAENVSTCRKRARAGWLLFSGIAMGTLSHISYPHWTDQCSADTWLTCALAGVAAGLADYCRHGELRQAGRAAIATAFFAAHSGDALLCKRARAHRVDPLWVLFSQECAVKGISARRCSVHSSLPSIIAQSCAASPLTCAK